jgi:hypothetical protein
LPFTADANDVEAHGRLIFADIVSGKYGDIADYVAQEENRIQRTSDIPVEVL